MPDTSSILKICPRCGQSVAIGLTRCPNCGSEFLPEESDFVAYERYNNGAQAPQQNYAGRNAAGNGQNANVPGSYGQVGDDTAVFTPVGSTPDAYGQNYGTSQNSYTSYGQSAAGQTAYPEENYGTTGTQQKKPRTMAEAASASAASKNAQEFSRGRSKQKKGASHPGVQQEDDDAALRRKSGLIVTIVAAVLLVAVIAVGVTMAFKLGVLGSKEETTPMMEAQDLVDSQQYADAITKLEAIVSSGDATVETYQLLAEAYTKNGDTAGAADAYLRGYQALNKSSLKKAAIDAYLKIGDKAKTEADYVSAQQAYNTVLNYLDSSNSSAIAGLNALAQLSGDGAAATTAPATSEQPAQTSSAAISPPAQSTTPSSSGTITQGDTAVATPTPVPTATPTPSPIATPTPTATPAPVVVPSTEPTPSEEPEPSPSEEPEPSPSPSPEPYTPSNTIINDTTEIASGYTNYSSAALAASADHGTLATVSSEDDFTTFTAAADALGLTFVWVSDASYDFMINSGHRNPEDIYSASHVALEKINDFWYMVGADDGDVTEWHAAGECGCIIGAAS